MPPRKAFSGSKVSDKERMALKRAMRTDEQKLKDKEANRLRMAKKRKEMSEEQKQKQRSSNRNSMAKKRETQRKEVKTATTVKKDYAKLEREYSRLYKARVRSGQTDPEHEYQMIYNLLCMRRLRRSLTDEERDSDKVKARDGMRVARKSGFIMPFQGRTWRDVDEMDLWRWFARRGTPFMNLLKEKKPDIADDIASVIQQEFVVRKEKEEQERKRREEGIWEYNPAMDTYVWTGKEPPTDGNPDPNIGHDEWVTVRTGLFPGEEKLTEEEWKEMEKKWREEETEQWALYYKAKRNERAREIYHQRKEALKVPIEMPDFGLEMSEYEKIRERTIKEREEALAAAGFSWKLD